MSKTLLIVNLGTPQAPTPKAVAHYLREFLNDKYVIDIPNPFRRILVSGIIVPTRSRKSAHAYQQVWRDDGSPLMFHSKAFFEKLKSTEKAAGDDGFTVKLAMRYGQPSLRHELSETIRGGAKEIYVWPMYPQYALSSTETVLNLCREVFAETNFRGQSYFIEEFCDNVDVAAVWSDNIASANRGFDADHLLLSYHGLPVSHVKKISAQCEGNGSCSQQKTEKNGQCYRRQCYETSEVIRRDLFCRAREGVRFSPRDISIGFQSRLTSGWIQPFSDAFYRELPKKGVKRLLVACPSFVTDCLETLEEVAIRGREEFRSHGGDDLKLVPCLNDSDSWVRAASEIVHDKKKWQAFKK